MKKILLATIVILGISSCDQFRGYHQGEEYKIFSKEYKQEPEMKGKCVFRYHYNWNYQTIEDSCNKYNVGDTVKH